jgi:uncharacterized protein DUF1302
VILRAARFGLLLAAGLAAARPGLAQTPLEELGISTSLRQGAWLSDRSLTDEHGFLPAMAWLRMQPPGAEGVLFRLEGWVAGDLADRDLDDGHGVRGELREAYLAWFGDRHELRIGRQIIVWGRADRLNPTDNLGSRDARLLVPEDDDQRRGSLMLRERLVLDDVTTLDLFWLPEFRPNRFPIRMPPPGIALKDVDHAWEPAQFAAKLERTGGDLDWSLSYFDGLDRNADFALQPAAFRLVHNRIRVLGADAAATVGRYGLRGEIAYTHTEDGNGDDPAVKNPFLFAVVGGDRSFFQYLNVNLQYFARLTRHHQDPLDIVNPGLRAAATGAAAAAGQLDAFQHGMSARIAYSWLNETLDTELAAIAVFSDGSVALRPKIVYRAADALRLTLGADLLRGGDTDAFGRLRDNSTVFLELRYGF